MSARVTATVPEAVLLRSPCKPVMEKFPAPAVERVMSSARAVALTVMVSPAVVAVRLVTADQVVMEMAPEEPAEVAVI